MLVYNDIKSYVKDVPLLLTMGSFDGVHRGHQALIARMRVLAQTMNAATAVLTFTPHPRLILGKDAGNLRLLCTDGEKSRRLEASGLDRLFFLPFDRHIADCEAEEFLNDWLVERMGVAGMVVGHDHRFGRMRRGNLDMLQDYARSHPAFVVAEQAALVSGTHAQTNAQTNAQTVSSTRIRRALADGQLAEANEMLGYAYSLSGEVVPDRQVGRTLGYPTANVRIDSAYKQLPAPGVYAAYARWGQEQRPAMVYYGGRPAFSGAGFALEVHILDYQGDLYGQILEVSLLQFIRGDLHFDDISSLKAQIYSDEQAIRRFLASAGTGLPG